MSELNPTQVNQEYYENLKRETFSECGLVFSGKNSEGEDEFIGTHKQWHKATALLEDKLDQI